MDSPTSYPESPLDPDEVAYPCKGCGEILEEGKAFELAGQRWHIDCFRCNTCGTALDSDANLLLLGDGSLICNNCTYSCSSCANKIEDLAILTGDQSFCANCFTCRNCKEKIENLRYARTSQGIFCMKCHEALMARRRKRTQRSAGQRHKAASNNALLDKSLPSLPPSAGPNTTFSPGIETPPSETHSETPTEVPPRLRPKDERQGGSRGASRERREQSPANGRTNSRGILNVPHFPSNSRHSSISHKSETEGGSAEEFYIPVAFDPTPPIQASTHVSNYKAPRADYFGQIKTTEHAARRPSVGTPSSEVTSPHIAYQEKGRVPSEEVIDSIKKQRKGSFGANGSAATSPLVGSGQTRQQYATSPQMAQNSRDVPAEEKFKLQEVPKAKRSGGSARSSQSGLTSPPAQALSTSVDESQGIKKSGEMFGRKGSVVQEPQSFVTQKGNFAYPSQDYRLPENGARDSSRSVQPSTISQLQYPPKRGDSLESTKTIPRKEVSAALSKSQESPQTSQGHPVASTTPNMASDQTTASEKVNGGKVISRPMESPKSKSIFDTSLHSKGDVGSNLNGSFFASRAPPSPPAEAVRSRKESLSTAPPETLKNGNRPISPGLPRWSAGGEFSMDEDMARILGGTETQGHESFLKRVSNSVRHGRSFSDKGLRASKELKWPRSPTSNNTIGQDINDPATTSPEHRDDLGWYKNELRRERQKAVEREQKIAELEATLHSTANIKQVNSELREKRSTIVVLDTQKEMVVRELEVLNEHIAAAKKSGDPLDLSKMSHAVIQDFAESLQKLKDSFAPQIEESVQKRNDLLDEISKLTRMKDKSFQEFEQLSLKNAQLAELNNQLVHQIQHLYKANSGAPVEQPRGAPNGLGIYSHHKDKSQVSIDSKDGRSNLNELATVSSGTTLQQEEAEPVTVLQGPHVVNIRKGQPKKFNWKKGGQNVAKGVTKGIKGAFSSTQASYSREMQFTETMPYGSTPPANDQPNNVLRHGNTDAPRQGFGLFGGNQKGASKGHQAWRAQSNSSPPPTTDASTTLFGSDLEARAEFEKSSIPFIVTRCVEEVELRGMDVEGIYRKTGGASQVQVIKDGFESSPQQTYDLSDPDLDIHAVSSALKQYFRRLPNPLITYEVYDRLLETTSISSHDAKVSAQARALMDLPKVHRDVLEFLVSHLKRVVSHERDNLMTSMNVAVVFAPTIMRPESLAREMTDTQLKNEAVQFLVENCQAVFAGVR